MENKIITITEEDKELYSFIKHCKDEQMIKNALSVAVELYEFCSGNTGELPGYLTPENFKERKLSKMSKDELLALRENYQKDILLFAQDFHPDEIDCGIMRGPDTEWWFIDDGSRLGYIALYAQYIKMIDEVLKGE